LALRELVFAGISCPLAMAIMKFGNQCGNLEMGAAQGPVSPAQAKFPEPFHAAGF